MDSLPYVSILVSVEVSDHLTSWDFKATTLEVDDLHLSSLYKSVDCRPMQL